MEYMGINRSDYRIIRIRELQVFANHGVYMEETQKGQNFYVNVDMEVLPSTLGSVDELDTTTNYAQVCQFITEWMQTHTFALLETVVERLGRDLLLRFALVEGVTLEVRKPEAPIGLPFASVSVEQHVSWHVAYIAIGSNMGNPAENIKKAMELLDEQEHTKVRTVAELLETKPYGYTEQDNFLNGAICVKTLLSPRKLLEFLNEIEGKLGRTREIHWGPRTMDLDILFYDNLVYEDPLLTIPHVDMENRYFVLKPLSEIAGFYRHPILGQTVNQLLAALPDCEEGSKA